MGFPAVVSTARRLRSRDAPRYGPCTPEVGLSVNQSPPREGLGGSRSMNTRSRTIASFFSVAMAALLFGAVVTSQIQRPMAAEARNLDPAAPPAPVGPAGATTLDTPQRRARRLTSGLVSVGAKRA